MPRAKKVEKVEETTTAEVKFRTATVRDYEIIVAPIVTEKTQNLQINNNTVTVEVAKDADKDEVKSAFEAIFSVNVDRKEKRVGRYNGFVKGYKKAIVKVNKNYNLAEIAKASNAE